MNPVHAHHPVAIKSNLISVHLRLVLPNGFFPWEFPTKTLYASYLSPIRSTYRTRLIRLGLITQTTFVEGFSNSFRKNEMGALSSNVSTDNRCTVWGFSCVWLAPPDTFWDVALCWALNAPSTLVSSLCVAYLWTICDVSYWHRPFIICGLAALLRYTKWIIGLLELVCSERKRKNWNILLKLVLGDVFWEQWCLWMRICAYILSRSSSLSYVWSVKWPFNVALIFLNCIIKP